MIQTIGLIVALYALARLLQAPLAYSGRSIVCLALLWIISVAGIVVIGALALDLVMSGVAS